MDRIRSSRWGRRIGDLSAAGVVAGSYVAVGLLALLFSDTAAEVAGVALIVVVAGYCLLRRTRRGDVFSAWIAPGCISTFTGDIFSVPKLYIGLPIAVLVVALLVYEDREEARAANG